MHALSPGDGELGVLVPVAGRSRDVPHGIQVRVSQQVLPCSLTSLSTLVMIGTEFSLQEDDENSSFLFVLAERDRLSKIYCSNPMQILVLASFFFFLFFFVINVSLGSGGIKIR